MKIFIRTYSLLIAFVLIGIHHNTFAQTKKGLGKIELVVSPYSGNKPIHPDSIYESPSGVKYSLRTLRFFMSDIALAMSTGKEYKASSEAAKNGVYFLDLLKPGNQKQSIEFHVDPGEYSDLRFSISVPRELNHSDPATAESPLNLGQAAEMYWEWNSGYIFFLTEGKIYNDKEEKLFHFALGNDSRAMPFSFGNLIDVTPLLSVQKNGITRINLMLDINKLLVNGDKSNYPLESAEQTIVHGGYYADVLRNNLLKAITYRSVEIIK